MKELDPQPRRESVGARDGHRVRRVPGPRRARVSSASTSRTSPSLQGLRIVVAECNRRGAVARTMGSLRWLSLAGAEVLYGDLGSDDGSADMVRARFPFAWALECVDAEGRGDADLLHRFASQAAPCAAPQEQPMGELTAPMRFVLFLSAGLEVDRFAVASLLRELSTSPIGSRVSMGLVGSAGGAAPSTAGSAWIVRRRDLEGVLGESIPGHAVAVAPR